ncbi:MAG: hypothetical protein HY296_05545 [Thaumarchaeota archaeon]|nr:hypothetical protein [Nitrososphaerota archaeon]
MARPVEDVVVFCLLILGTALLSGAPSAWAIASGAPNLGTVTAVPSGGTLTLASTSVTVPPGSWQVTAIDGVPVAPATHLLTIEFGGVTFSGAQFYLSMSKDGLSAASAGDVRYSPLFTVSDFAANVGTLKAVSNVNGTFYIGEYGGIPIVVGPTPVFVSSAYKFIKVYDGTTVAAIQSVILTSSAAATTTSTATTTVSSVSTTTASHASTSTATVTSSAVTTVTVPGGLETTTTTVVEPSLVTTTETETSTLTTIVPTTTTVYTSALTHGTSSTSGGSSGIPEFPFQLGFSLLAALAVVSLYVLARRGLGRKSPVRL